MINFVLALAMMGFILAGVGAFLIWAFWQWRTAQKYRYLLRLYKQIPPEELHARINKGCAWRITYKERGKLRTIDLEGKTEAEVLKVFVTTNNVAYGNIVKSEKL